jgi:hypothetical protein
MVVAVSNGPALVVGGIAAGDPPPEVLVTVVRPFCVGGQRKEVGETVALSPATAAEVLYSGRATLGTPATPAEADQATEPEAEVETPAKGKRHARK